MIIILMMTGALQSRKGHRKFVTFPNKLVKKLSLKNNQQAHYCIISIVIGLLL